jgi:hypothetical protein
MGAPRFGAGLRPRRPRDRMSPRPGGPDPIRLGPAPTADRPGLLSEAAPAADRVRRGRRPGPSGPAPVRTPPNLSFDAPADVESIPKATVIVTPRRGGRPVDRSGTVARSGRGTGRPGRGRTPPARWPRARIARTRPATGRRIDPAFAADYSIARPAGRGEEAWGRAVEETRINGLVTVTSRSLTPCCRGGAVARPRPVSLPWARKSRKPGASRPGELYTGRCRGGRHRRRRERPRRCSGRAAAEAGSRPRSRWAPNGSANRSSALKDAGLPPRLSPHSFRVTGITA